MARITENICGKRNIILSEEDVISIVQEYQNLTKTAKSYEEIRHILKDNKICIPEEFV
ncbi:MAG: hypothetical protein ACI37Z_05275 [Candidatus Gastranaerophilaceae bacterium]